MKEIMLANYVLVMQVIYCEAIQTSKLLVLVNSSELARSAHYASRMLRKVVVAHILNDFDKDIQSLSTCKYST